MRVWGKLLTAAMMSTLMVMGVVVPGVSPAATPGTAVELRAVPSPALMAAASAAVMKRTGPIRISVLCDSVGNDLGEWVNVWARHLSQDRDVHLHYYEVVAPGGKLVSHRWNPKVHTFPAKTPSGKAPVTIWDFGWAGGTPLMPLQHPAQAFPETPDLVVYSYGLNLAAENVVPQFSKLHRYVRSHFGQVPVVGTLAHMTPAERPGQARGRTELAAWMLKSGIPFVDDRTVFDPFRPSRTGQVFMDPVHPNAAGHVLLGERILGAIHVPSGQVMAARVGKVKVGQRTEKGKKWRFPVAIVDAVGRPVPYAVASITTRRGTTVVEGDHTGTVWVTIRKPGAGSQVSVAVTDGITSGATSFRA